MSSPHQEKKYDTLIVDSDIDSRMRLKTAMVAVYTFGKSVQSVDLHEGLHKLQGTDPFDVIFLSYRFPKEEVINFIKQAKETKTGQDAAYVLVLPTKDQDASTVAQNVMTGADGFLFEPYSVDLLVEITQLSSRVKAERSATREKAALAMIVHEVVNQIDQLSYIKACKMDLGTSMRRLRDTCSMFKDLDPEKLAVYFECALKAFEEAPIPTQIFQVRRYTGVSSRIRKNMEKKILSEIQKTELAKK